MNQKANKAHLKESMINKLLVCIISHPKKCVLLTLTLMSLIATGLFSVKSKWSTKAWYDSDHKEMKKL